MTIVLTALHVIVCLLLITVILLQVGRGHGLAGASFGGGGVQSLFGTRASDFLAKATTVAAVLFLLTSIGLDIVHARRSRSLLDTPTRPLTQEDVGKIQEALEKLKAEAARQAEEAPAPLEQETAESVPAE